MCSRLFFEESIRIIIGFEALERNVIENAELPLQKFLDGNHEVWRRSTHLYFDLTFVALSRYLRDLKINDCHLQIGTKRG